MSKTDIEVGRKIKFIPAGWTAGGPNIFPDFMVKHVVGHIVMVDTARALFRVEYEAKGELCHECFKLPLLPCDKVQKIWA